MTIRHIQPGDAEAFLSLCKKLDAETELMMLEPGERTLDAQEQRREIETLTENQTIFVAEEEGALVGFLALYGSQPRRKRHCAYLVVGVLQARAGRGVGTALFERAERWAKARDLTRLELTVMTHNRAALALYHRRGFLIEGLLRDSLKVRGRYIHEYAMAKLL